VLGIIEFKHNDLMFMSINLVIEVHLFSGLIENEDFSRNTAVSNDV